MDSRRMGDTQHANDFPELMIDQIRELAETVCEVFGGNLSQKDFSDKLLTFLGDVMGYETGEVAAALLESVWAEYAKFDNR